MGIRPLISSSVTTGLIDAIAATNANVDQVRKSLTHDFTTLANAQGFIACADFARLLEEIAQATGDGVLAPLWRAQQPKKYRPADLCVLNSPTIAIACATAARYLHVHNQALQPTLDVDSSSRISPTLTPMLDWRTQDSSANLPWRAC